MSPHFELRPIAIDQQIWSHESYAPVLRKTCTAIFEKITFFVRIKSKSLFSFSSRYNRIVIDALNIIFKQHYITHNLYVN